MLLFSDLDEDAEVAEVRRILEGEENMLQEDGKERWLELQNHFWSLGDKDLRLGTSFRRSFRKFALIPDVIFFLRMFLIFL